VKFTYTTPDINYPVCHLISENGKWECGFSPVLFGVRFRISEVGASCCEADLCCGDSGVLRAIVLSYCLEQMEKLDEKTVTPIMINKMFPPSKIKPLDHDPEWCKRLNIEIKERHFV
jgi:hypothetical protein